MRIPGPRILAGTLAAAALAAGGVAPASAAPADGFKIDVISNRADIVSAGDALVAVELPSRVAPETVRVTDDGRDVTASFAVRPNGRFEGLVSGLSLGENVLAVSAPGAKTKTLTVVNHPNGGPVFSGPQVQPWVCQASATDSQCNQPASY